VGLARAHCGGWRGLATACVVYVGATHAHGLDDGLYHTGRAVVLLLHRTAHALFNVRNNPDNKDATSAAVYQHFVEVFVRAFFSPLLFCSVCDNLPMLHYKGFPNYMVPVVRLRYVPLCASPVLASFFRRRALTTSTTSFSPWT
jgi:hypothetical protein